MNKNRLFLVMQREYYAIVAKKSFIISTILVPLLMLLIGVVPVLLSQFNSSDEAETVTIVDNSANSHRPLRTPTTIDSSIYPPMP